MSSKKKVLYIRKLHIDNILHIHHLCTLESFKDKRFEVFFLLLFSCYTIVIFSCILFLSPSMDSVDEELSLFFFNLTR